jgi:hypothetical protein
MAAERAAEARKQADTLACDAWTKRMLAFNGPAQPSATLGDALNAGFLYLEVRCLGCDTHQTVALECASTEVDPDPRAGALLPVQGLLGSTRLSVQAQLSGRASAHEDFSERSAVVLVTGGKIGASERGGGSCVN